MFESQGFYITVTVGGPFESIVLTHYSCCWGPFECKGTYTLKSLLGPLWKQGILHYSYCCGPFEIKMHIKITVWRPCESKLITHYSCCQGPFWMQSTYTLHFLLGALQWSLKGEYLHISVAFGGPFESKLTAHCSLWRGAEACVTLLCSHTFSVGLILEPWEGYIVTSSMVTPRQTNRPKKALTAYLTLLETSEPNFCVIKGSDSVTPVNDSTRVKTIGDSDSSQAEINGDSTLDQWLETRVRVNFTKYLSPDGQTQFICTQGNEHFLPHWWSRLAQIFCLACLVVLFYISRI